MSLHISDDDILGQINDFIRKNGYKFEPSLEEDQIQNYDTDEFKGWSLLKKVPIGKMINVLFMFHDWRTEKRFEWQQPISGASQKQLKELQAQQEKFRKDFEREKDNEQRRIAQVCAEKFYKHPTTSYGSSYLKDKAIMELHGARNFRTAGKDIVIVVPAYDMDNFLWGYQCIREDGKKHWFSGQRTKGVFFRIGKVENRSETILVCEGYSTACSVYQATGMPTFAAFSAGNLGRVTNSIRDEYPDNKIVICADDDRWKGSENAGRNAAEKAANRNWAGFTLPRFRDTHRDAKPTDFNDLFVLQGQAVVSEQLRVAAEKTPKPPSIYPLGHIGKDAYYISSTANKTITKQPGWSELDLHKLLPDEGWWLRRFGVYDERIGALKLDVDQAAKWLIEGCTNRGILNKERIRGCGQWLDRCNVRRGDDGRTSGDENSHLGSDRSVPEADKILHLGDRLLVNGKECDIQDYPSKNLYDLRPRIDIPKWQVLKDGDAEHFEKTVTRLNWKIPIYARYLMGWLACSVGAGALKWRPHIWITGEAGSGKSTVLDNVLKPLLSDIPIFESVNTTEAGIRDEIKCDAIPVVIDEADTYSDRGRIKGVIDLCRVASSGGKISRGTADGEGRQYRARFAAIFSGINPPGMSSADESRVTFLEMVKGKGDVDWTQLEKDLAGVCSAELGGKLFWTVYERLEVLRESADVLQKAVALEIGDQRRGQQLGALMAGWWIWSHSEAISLESACDLVRGLGEVDEEAIEEGKDNKESCLDHLLASVVRGDDGSFTVGQAVVDGNWMELVKLGIVQKDSSTVFIPNVNPELRKIFRDTEWPKWNKSLLRLECVDRGRTSTARGVIIPLQEIKDRATVVKNAEF